MSGVPRDRRRVDRSGAAVRGRDVEAAGGLRLASTAARPLRTGGPDYRVRYPALLAREPHRIRAVLLMTGAPVLTAVLLCYLLWPRTGPGGTTRRSGWCAADTALLVLVGVVELFRGWSTSRPSRTPRRRPGPPRPRTGPGRAPQRPPSSPPTCPAGTPVHGPGHPGGRRSGCGTGRRLHVWLLDEGATRRPGRSARSWACATSPATASRSGTGRAGVPGTDQARQL